MTATLDSTQLDAAFNSTAIPAAFVQQPQPAHQLHANLDNQVLLVGYDLDCMTPDGRVALTLYWQALADLKIDYHVFVHLAGGLEPGSPAGIWGQSDGVPGSVSAPLLLWDSARLLASQQGGVEPLPTSTWRKGQLIRDRRSFQIPAATPQGRYTLIAGLYQLQTGERLQLIDAENKPIADYVQLTSVVMPTTTEVAAGEAP